MIKTVWVLTSNEELELSLKEYPENNIVEQLLMTDISEEIESLHPSYELAMEAYSKWYSNEDLHGTFAY